MGRRGGRGRGGGRNAASSYQMVTDLLTTVAQPPVIMNGICSYTGSQMSVQALLESFAMIDQEQMALNQGRPITQLNLLVVGSKSKTSNQCCYTMTVMAGSCLIFPLFFMCCGWWKRIVYPMYEINLSVYQSLEVLLRNGVNNLTLRVVDSSFNAQKARILYDVLSKSRVTSFTFENRAQEMNYKESQADDFVANMAPIRTLNLTASMIWGTTIA